MMLDNNKNKYPCANPFSQLYLVPRDRLYIRFCPFHSDMAAIKDYDKMGLDELSDFFVNDKTVNDVREKFLKGDFEGAGCPESCECMGAFRIGAASYSDEEYRNENGDFVFSKANLSMGPDCNINCRYCLDAENFEIDYNSCKPQIGDFIVPFVRKGGSLLLTGGETLLPKWGFINKLKELASYPDCKGRIEFFTNATLLDDDACDAILAAPVEFVGISMDTCRPELFNYIRRGSDFDHVLKNAKNLLEKKRKAGKENLHIRILCAVLKSTALYLEETVDFFVSEGFEVSLNILFKANFSPDFCERESLDRMSLPDLERVEKQLKNIEEKYGEKVYSASLKGQLQNVMKQKRTMSDTQQILGGGRYAKRKDGINPSIKKEVGDLKLFISYHKDGEIVSSETMIPIHVGAATSRVDLGIQRDDEGDNISIKNDKYCELTAQYWAWKNCDADYYGFMHYRRHFAFRDIREPVGSGGVVDCKKLNEGYRNYIGLWDNEIYAAVKDYDLILPPPVDTSAWGTINNEVQFSSLSNLHAKEFDIVCDCVKRLYPDYSDAVDEFRKGIYAYWYNMFIMRKDIFREYSEWLFTILEEAEKKTDFTYFNEQEMRTLAFMAERLLSIFVIKLMIDNPDLRVKHLKITMLKNTDKQIKIKPAFEENNVAIAFSCNEYYMPILGVMLHSLLVHADTEHNYDILIMQNNNPEKTDMMKRYEKLLGKIAGEYSNVSLRFVDISGHIGNRDFFVRGNFTPETYFRLFLPQILDNYEKVLYLDADMVACHDISELYDVDLDGAMIGAVRDPIISGSNKSPLYNKQNYLQKLGIKNIYDYFQAGVLLIDLKKISEDGLCERMIEYAATHDCDLVDQDVLNLFCQGHVKYLDNKWNVDVNTIALDVVKYAPAKMWKEYLRNREDAYIYHFAGADKPWNDPNLDKADIFWMNARQTPWYEIILEGMIEHNAFYKRGADPAIKEKLRKLRFWPKDIAELVIPIMKSYSELSSLGMSDILTETIRNGNCDYNDIVKGKRVLFYGAGFFCRQILLYFDQLGLSYPDEIWDMSAKQSERLFGVEIHKPDFQSLRDQQNIVAFITIESPSISQKVMASFKSVGFKSVYSHGDLMRVLSTMLWTKLEQEES